MLPLLAMTLWAKKEKMLLLPLNGRVMKITHDPNCN